MNDETVSTKDRMSLLLAAAVLINLGVTFYLVSEINKLHKKSTDKIVYARDTVMVDWRACEEFNMGEYLMYACKRGYNYSRVKKDLACLDVTYGDYDVTGSGFSHVTIKYNGRKYIIQFTPGGKAFAQRETI